MGNKLIKIVLSLVLIAGMIGIAVAEPCPATPKLDVGFKFAKVVQTDLGSNNFKYEVQTLIATPDFEIREVCVYNDDAIKSGPPSLTTTFKPGNLWNTISKDDYFGWDQNSGTNLMPLTSEGFTEVGHADWGATDPQPDKHYNLHISDKLGTICPKDPSKPDEPGTCFVDPDFVPPDGNIPEFPTVALPVAAVLGMMFLMSRSKKKE